jgi:hypothetical protein
MDKSGRWKWMHGRNQDRDELRIPEPLLPDIGSRRRQSIWMRRVVGAYPISGLMPRAALGTGEGDNESPTEPENAPKLLP